MTRNSKQIGAAIVLAAGESKRMRPLGANLPKVMLPILGKPVLYYVIVNLIAAGIKNVILVVSPASQGPVKKYFGAKFGQVNIDYVVQKQQLGPAHALSLALPRINKVFLRIKSDYFLVQYGDSLADENVALALIDVLGKTKAADGVLATQEVADPTRYGIIRYQNGQVVEIVEKPDVISAPSNQAVVGTFILKTAAFRKAIKDKKFILGREFFPAQYILAQGGKTASWRFSGQRVDVGKPQDLFAAGQLLAKKPIKCIAFDADNTLYNTHQVAKFADLDAFKILEDSSGVARNKIYKDWQKIVSTVADAKVPEKRTRLYSYNLLLSKLNQDKSILDKMYQNFTKSLTRRIKSAQNIKEILKSLSQTKVIITEDIKSLAILKLKSTGLYNFFDKIIAADDIGTMKPSQKYYKFLLAKYQPQEILVVGDDWQKDLEIPARLGMQVLFIEKEDDLAKLRLIRGPTPLGVEPLKRIHIMGIAGAGASSIAGIAQNYGYSVSGCDLVSNSPYVKNLKVDIAAGHDSNHLNDVDLLVISPAVEKLNPDNGELQKARQTKMQILTWQEFQGKFLQKNKFVICVAGAYGKSTTTAMIAQILTDAGLDPTCEIGAKVLAINSNFQIGKSRYYICEGDEYNNNFLNYQPDIAVVLNMVWDHPDFFKSRQEVAISYQKFIANIKPGGTLVIPNDPQLIKIASFARSDIKVVQVKDFGKLNLSIIGDFRIGNAYAALTVAKILGVNANLAKKSAENFKGTGRRLEYKGKIGKVKFYDDYAVQPQTILKTADALKEKFNDKEVLLVLEPHTFTRIKVFFNDFVKSLRKSRVDQVYITDVYAAREKGNSRALAQKLSSAVGPRAQYTGSIEQTATYIKKHLKNFSVVCSMGAGDSYKLYDLIKKVSP